MFTLESLHITTLILAMFLVIFIMVSFIGYSKDVKATTVNTPYFSRLAPLIIGDTREEYRYEY